MQSCSEIIKILIKVNFFASLIAFLVFAVIRGQQSALTGNQQERSERTVTYRSYLPEDRSNTANLEPMPPEIVTITQYRQLEQQLKALEKQIIIQKTDNSGESSPKNVLLKPNNPQDSNAQTASIPPSIAPVTATSPTIIQPAKLEEHPISQEQSVATPSRSVVVNRATAAARNHPQESEANNSIKPERIAVRPDVSLGSHLIPDLSAESSLFGQPQSLAINLDITPPPEKSPETSEEKPKAQPAGNEAVHTPITSKKIKKDLISYANDISAGLLVAGNKGQINYGTTNYRRVQTAIVLLRQGEDMENAARRAKVSLETLQQLIKWGKNRPGSLTASTAHDSSEANWY
jgi:hypothetical protein